MSKCYNHFAMGELKSVINNCKLTEKKFFCLWNFGFAHISLELCENSISDKLSKSLGYLVKRKWWRKMIEDQFPELPNERFVRVTKNYYDV